VRAAKHAEQLSTQLLPILTAVTNGVQGRLPINTPYSFDLDLDSTRIRMDAFGHTLTPF